MPPAQLIFNESGLPLMSTQEPETEEQEFYPPTKKLRTGILRLKFLYSYAGMFKKKLKVE